MAAVQLTSALELPGVCETAGAHRPVSRGLLQCPRLSDFGPQDQGSGLMATVG